VAKAEERGMFFVASRELAMVQQPGSGSTNGDIWSIKTAGRDMMFINQAISETWSTLESRAENGCK